MRFAHTAVPAAAMFALASSAVASVVYTDAANDTVSYALPEWDIRSVEVSHTDTTLKFSITIGGSVSYYSQYRYGIALSTPGSAPKSTGTMVYPGSGVAFASNGGANYYVWTEMWYGGCTWFHQNSTDGWGGIQNGNSSLSPNYDTNTFDVYVNRAAVGLDASDTSFFFDVFSTGRNDSVFDALSTNSVTGGFQDYGAVYTATNALSYTIGNPVPAPGAVALLGAAGLAGTRRRRA